MSGSMGLGHAVRDLAIAEELRREAPEVAVTWLAGGAARMAIEEAGGKLHPRADDFPGLDEAAEAAANGFELRLGDYGTHAVEVWRQHYALFRQIVATDRYDLIVGDETYEIWFPLHDEPAALPCPFVMVYDFVGLGRVGLRQRLARTHDWFNERQATDHLLMARTGSRVVFVGELEDITFDHFGVAMPRMRRYAERHYTIVGHVLRFDPRDYRDPAETKRRLGYGDEPLIIAAVGGTAVGKALLELCGAAYPLVVGERPRARMVLVCGPRLSPDAISVPQGVTVLRYVPRLYEHFAAADLAITQGGGSSTAELTALGRPFLYFPLTGHEEQRAIVAARQSRLGAGVELDFAQTGPRELARAVIEHLSEEVSYPTIDSGGARKVAHIIAVMLDSRRE